LKKKEKIDDNGECDVSCLNAFSIDIQM